MTLVAPPIRPCFREYSSPAHERPAEGARCSRSYEKSALIARQARAHRLPDLLLGAAVGRAERLRRLTVFQRKFTALPVDGAVDTSYGQLAPAVIAAGRQPRPRVLDLLVAATGQAHSARLYTRNAGDLVGIEHLVEIVSV